MDAEVRRALKGLKVRKEFKESLVLQASLELQALQVLPELRDLSEPLELVRLELQVLPAQLELLVPA